MATPTPLSPSSHSFPHLDEMGDSQVIQIATNGDICLEIRKMPGNTKLHLQVSSHTLCEASNRFDREFNSSWKESIERAEANSAPGEKACVIQLSDDDADALILLFHVLHHKIQAVPTKCTPAQLLDLAVVADKYCCEKPLFPWTSVWLQGYLEELERGGMTFAESCEILYFSYIMDLPGDFDKISKAILFKYPATAFNEFPEHFLIRGNIFGKEIDITCASPAEFKARNVEMFLQIHECMENGFENIQKKRCASRAQFILRIRKALGRSGLWPLSIASQKFSVTETCDKLSEIRLCGAAVASALAKRCSTCRDWGYSGASRRQGYCYYPSPVNEEFKSSLMLNLFRLREGMRGVCLDCVKTSGESGMKHKCRLPH
ncbi:hypothetical protein EMPG_11464 [Blastomyces silverae]|uniref:BTB domain-containing protein n=1 Tax=Blastomyces silverae TaxID=2060906 RepID=A0A0H1BRG6_9EURO|nr:hypothetical protein EMPG_11464 [Blastomyces silverae]